MSRKFLVPLALPADPTQVLEATPKQYVDLRAVPAGGAAGQHLAKASATDYALAWTDPPTSGAGDQFTYSWKTTTTAVDPTGGGVKCNNADPTVATAVYISMYDSGGTAGLWLLDLQVGNRFALYKPGDINTFIRYTVSSTPTNNGPNTWFTIPVTLHQEGTTGFSANNNQAVQVGPSRTTAAVVTNTDLADMATNTIKGRVTTGTGDPEDLTPAQARTVIASDAGGTTNFFRADGTFAAPTGGGFPTQGYVSASTDWDTVLTDGIYVVDTTATNTNGPPVSTSYGVLTVMTTAVAPSGASAGYSYKTQTYYSQSWTFYRNGYTSASTWAWDQWKTLGKRELGVIVTSGTGTSVPDLQAVGAYLRNEGSAPTLTVTHSSTTAWPAGATLQGVSTVAPLTITPAASVTINSRNGLVVPVNTAWRLVRTTVNVWDLEFDAGGSGGGLDAEGVMDLLGTTGLVEGSGVDLTYDDTAGTITVAATGGVPVGTKLTALTALTGTAIAGPDIFEVVDVSDTTMAASGTNKKMTLDELGIALGTFIVLAAGMVDTSALVNNAVTNVKLADMAPALIKGRAAGAGSGDPVDLTAAQVKTILALTGADLTNDSVTNTQLATMPTLTIKGNNTAGTAGPQDLTVAQTRSMVASGAGAFFGFDFDTTTTAGPAVTRVRINNATPASATIVYVSYTSKDGVDLKTRLLAGTAGDRLYIQDRANSANYRVYELTAAPTDSTTYATCNVVHRAGGGSLWANLTEIVAGFTSAPFTVGPTAPTAPLTGDLWVDTT